MIEITEKEKETLTEVLSSVVKVNTQMKLHGHQIDNAQQEEITLRGVLYKLSKLEFDKSS